MDKKAVFTRIYANLPLGSRNEIVIVVDDEPMTWKAVWLEVEQNTPLLTKILEKLDKLGFLNE